MRKRLLATILAFCMALGMLPGTVWAAEPEDGVQPMNVAEEGQGTWEAVAEPVELANAPTSGTCGENARWSFSGGTLTISGSGPMEDYDLDDLVCSSPWYHLRAAITFVVIGDGITSIGDMAFYTCIRLTSIIIPDSVTSIGADAFFVCYGLRSIIIPNSVISIGDGAFSYCSSLSSIQVDPNNLNYASLNGVLISKNGDTLVAFPAGRQGTYTVPLSVTSIGNSAFIGCKSLTSIFIPNSVTSIGDSAFHSCSSLTRITIPDSVTFIGIGTFRDCNSLTSITIPNTVTSIGLSAFYDCSSLTDVYFSGDEAQWASIMIGSFNEKLTSATIHYNSTGPDDPPPSGDITFRVDSGKDFTIEVGEILPIAADFSAIDGTTDPVIMWFTDNPDVADIDHTGIGSIGPEVTSSIGWVKGVSPGIAEISVALPDGRTGSCKVEVVIDPNKDTDGDGLYDIWEICGVDTDGDGEPDLNLKEMGADPNVPDIFVEVDWMVRPPVNIEEGSQIIQQIGKIYAPSEKAMESVYKAFKAHGINLHIDFGPDSTDFAAKEPGKKWGDYPGGSGGEALPYEDIFAVGDDNSRWLNYVNEHFKENRRNVFHHALFVNRYYRQDTGADRSGLSDSKFDQNPIVVGQHLIVATEATANTNESIAGTFMHELGHTLGLTHGGIIRAASSDETDLIGQRDSTNGKPNYLSVMNYLFQSTGIIRSKAVSDTAQINYSEYTLPTLDENALLENAGIDPNKTTEGTGLMSRYYVNGIERTTAVISGAKIDFDGKNGIDTKPVAADINGDEKKTKLYATASDWENLIFTGGDIGKRQRDKASYVAGNNLFAADSGELELSLKEAIEKGVLADVGAGTLEAIGPFSLSLDAKNQSVFLRVFNPANEQVKFDLHVDESSISAGFDQEVTVEPSRTSISYIDIPIAIKDAQALGSYEIHATLYYSGKEVTDIDIPVSVQSYTSEDIAALKRVIQTGSEEIPETVINEYADILESIKNDPSKTYTITFFANGGTGTMLPATVAADEAYTLPVCTFTAPTCKVFKAWLIDGTEYAPGTSLAFTADTTATAVWQDTEPVPEHTHNWAIAWSHDATHHWHECTAKDCPITSNNEMSGYGAHTYDDAMDTTCNDCGYIRAVTPEHTHSWSVAWSNNVTHHWHECSASNCPITANSGKDGYGPHIYDDDADTTCNICGYTRTVTPPAPSNPSNKETYYISIPKFIGGEIITSARYAENGERVTLTAHPNVGYELDSITVTNVRGREITLRDLGSGRYSFTMPDSRVTVGANFSEVQEETPATTPVDEEPFTNLGSPGISGIVLNPAAMPFTDVYSSDWFYNSVEYMWKHYLMSGVSDTQFAPNATTSRAMIWTVLARMNNVRTDINPGSNWYEKGMLWAMEQGVTDGSNPMNDITREQLATMLWRNAGSPGGTADLNQFSDSGSVSDYAASAIRWAAANGILQGSDGKLNPQGTATRAQVAAMVQRYGERIGA